MSPLKAVQDVIPEEKWLGKKPHVSHLRVFGSVAYALVPEEKREKLDVKCIKLLFVGYSESRKPTG